MSDACPTCPALADAPVISAVQTDGDRYQWRICRPHAAVLQPGKTDWFHLERCSTATLVKRNSQRDVWRVKCGGQDYFAKLYHPNGALARLKLLLRGPTALREWNVGTYAAAHSIATVVPVATAWTGSRGGSGPSLLITQAVVGAEPLNEHWLKVHTDRRAADELMHLLARLIARAHQCGFQHGDMHPGNILVRPNGPAREAFFVDLHKVRTARPVGLKAIVANLAQLNQWFRRHATRTQLRRFLKYYLAYRNQYAMATSFARRLGLQPASLIADLSAQADRHARALWAKRDRRSRRTGRYFARIRPAPGWRGHVLLSSKHPAPTAGAAGLTFTRGQWEQWLRHPLSWADPDRHELLKDSHTATVCRAVLPTDPTPVAVIVKRPLARNLGKRLGQMFGRSRNMRAWRMANMLLNRNLPAAQPLAVLERYTWGVIRRDSISITDFVAASTDLETFLTRDVPTLDQVAQRRVKNRLLDSVVALLKAFSERGFVHRDLKAPNLLVSWEPPHAGTPRLTFVDMDGISHVRRPTQKQRTRAIVRLCASLLGGPAGTRTDRLRFLKRYLTGPGRAPSDWKTHWRRIDRQVHDKMVDQEARRRWKFDRYGRE
jgi:Ser/Thr protein kinase RdoA (MazF antagonist)